ncbi:MAG: hypothetical protein WA056_02230 [Gallionella sp.]
MSDMITFRIDERTNESLERIIEESGMKKADFYRLMVEEKIQEHDLKRVLREHIKSQITPAFNEQSKKIDAMASEIQSMNKWFKWLQSRIDLSPESNKPSSH